MYLRKTLLIIKTQLKAKHPALELRDGDEAPSIKSSPSLLKNQNINYKEKRLTFKSERIEGSVNLYGATLDEIILRDYFETIKRK